MSLASVALAAYPYAASLLAVGLLCGWIAKTAWVRSDAPGATSLVWLMVGAGIWNAVTAVQLVVHLRPVAVGLEVVVHGCIALIVASFLALTIEYAGRDDLLTRRTVVLLAVHPVVIVLASATNPWHRLVWRSIEPTAVPFDTLTVSLGPVFWVHAVYSYALILIGIGIVATLVVRWRSIYQRQAAALLVGAIVPLVTNVAFLLWNLRIDIQPLAFAVTGLAAAWAIRRYRLIDLIPIARDQIVSTLADPMIVIDDRERISDANPPARALFDDGSDIVGRSLSELPDTGSPLMDTLRDLATATEQRERHVETATRHFDVRAVPLTDERDDRRGVVVTFHDVTEREESRRELERQNEQLEQFASVVSHDLRNPLSVADGYLPMARETGEDEHFDAIEESLDRMNAIIEDVLTLAREGSRIEDRTPVSLADVAETAWEQVDTGDAELVVADDVTIGADASRLQRLLENLFRNALEHGPGENDDEPLTITVGPIGPESPGSLRPTEEFGFFVEDDGVGIPQADRETIFEAGHSTSSEGTGLGLSIVHGIAEAHGWTVRATESETRGARFDVTGVPPISHPATVGSSPDGAQR